jgi:V/A-type H+-transporting ATPase subunit A
LRVVGALWALDPALAHQRQFPAVDWQTSYSLYGELLSAWFEGSVDRRWSETRAALLELLQRDGELREIAAVVGPEALEDGDRLLLEAGAMARQRVLGQSAFDPNDAFSPLQKTIHLARGVVDAHAAAKAALGAGLSFADLDLSRVKRALTTLRDAPVEQAADHQAELAASIAALAALAASKEEER